MLCPYCGQPGIFSPGYYHCDACVAKEAADLIEQGACSEAWRVAMDAAITADDASDADPWAGDADEAAVAAAEAEYDAWEGKR